MNKISLAGNPQAARLIGMPNRPAYARPASAPPRPTFAPQPGMQGPQMQQPSYFSNLFNGPTGPQPGSQVGGAAMQPGWNMQTSLAGMPNQYNFSPNAAQKLLFTSSPISPTHQQKLAMLDAQQDPNTEHLRKIWELMQRTGGM